MRWDGKKIGTYSAIVTALLGASVLFLFGLGPFGCKSGAEDCIAALTLTTLITYLSVYACFWFFIRFGNLGGVRHDDQF